MYTKSYYQSPDPVQIPPSYSGTALSQDGSEESYDEPKMVKNKESVPSWLDKIQLKSFLPRLDGLFSKGFKLGTEEIIIIALIAFLIFSKSADLECIIMLAALLLI